MVSGKSALSTLTTLCLYALTCIWLLCEYVQFSFYICCSDDILTIFDDIFPRRRVATHTWVTHSNKPWSLVNLVLYWTLDIRHIRKIYLTLASMDEFLSNQLQCVNTRPAYITQSFLCQKTHLLILYYFFNVKKCYKSIMRLDLFTYPCQNTSDELS